MKDDVCIKKMHGMRTLHDRGYPHVPENISCLFKCHLFSLHHPGFHVNERNVGISGLRQGPKDVTVYQGHNYTTIKQCLVTLWFSISIFITSRVDVSASRLNSNTLPSISFKYYMCVRVHVRILCPPNLWRTPWALIRKMLPSFSLSCGLIFCSDFHLKTI